MWWLISLSLNNNIKTLLFLYLTCASSVSVHLYWTQLDGIGWLSGDGLRRGCGFVKFILLCSYDTYKLLFWLVKSYMSILWKRLLFQLLFFFFILLARLTIISLNNICLRACSFLSLSLSTCFESTIFLIFEVRSTFVNGSFSSPAVY